ncbi:MAG: DUF2934 domain-containing protein [Kiritimatiellia bacterium]
MSAKKKTTTEKTETVKAPAKKAAAKKAPAKKAPAKKAAVKKAPAKKTATKKAAPKTTSLSAEERYQRVQFEAYLMAEKNGFKGDSSAYWIEAEKIVDKQFA